MTETLEIDRETKQLLKALELTTGKQRDVVLKDALRAEFERRSTVRRPKLSDDEIRRKVQEIQERVAKQWMPDDRTNEEIIGYDENGLP